MEVKEAIKLLGMWKIQRFTIPTEKEIEGFIECLQQGEKYHMMWDILKMEEEGQIMISLGEIFMKETAGQLMEKIEQKYFPKEAKQDEAK